MVGIYARVSTRQQDEEGWSLDDQIERGKKWAVTEGEPYAVYSEAASGKSRDGRAKWSSLEKDIESKKIDKVWVIDNDRLARNRRDASLIEGLFIDNKAALFIDGEKINWEDDSAYLLYGIKSVTADFFRRDLIKKIRRGTKACKDAGEWRVWRLIGYKVPTEKDVIRREIIPEQADTVRRIFDLYCEGRSLRKVTDMVNAEGRRTVLGTPFDVVYTRRLLLNPRFAGLTPNTKGELIESKCYPPIISVAQWKAAQKCIANGASRNITVTSKANHPCTSIIRCGECGARYHYNSIKPKRGRRVPCYAHQRVMLRCGQHPVVIKADVVNSSFYMIYSLAMLDLDSVRRFHREAIEKVEREQSEAAEAVTRIEHLIAEQNAKREKLIDALEKGAVSVEDVGDRITAIKQTITKLESDRDARLHEVKLHAEETDAILGEYSRENCELFFRGDGLTRRNMLKRIIKSATLTGRNFRVELTSGHSFAWEYRPRSPDVMDRALLDQANHTATLEMLNPIAEMVKRLVDEEAKRLEKLKAERDAKYREKSIQGAKAPGRESHGKGRASGRVRGAK